MEFSPDSSTCIINYLLQSRRGRRSVALPAPGPQPYIKVVLPSCWDLEPEQNPVVVFLLLMCPPRSYCDLVTFLPLHSLTRWSEVVSLPLTSAFSRSQISLFPSGRNASHKCQPVLCAEAGPPLTCQTCHFLNKAVELWDLCKWLCDLIGLILTGLIQLVFVFECLFFVFFFLNLNFINTVCAPKDEPFLTFQAPSSCH